MEDKENRIFSVFLSLGSNLGNKERNIEFSYKKIEELIGDIKSSSAFFYSSPVGFISENNFVNSVCEVTSYLDVDSIFATSQRIEKEMGRVGKSLHGVHSDRIIDIDILLINDLIINRPDLIIPHPRLHERSFVIIPLSEIAGDVLHPVLKKTIRELKEEFYRKFQI
jgi:2-amino-4-hydroxy-6-hydroxymethyldihydropteridine diphosphokinase